MKNLILAGAAALAFAMPAAADHHMEGEVTTYQLSEDQMMTYDGWPEDRRAVYDAWPYGVQEYYWTLEPMQMEGFWMLTDPQRVRIYEMTPDQRAMAWQQINAQMSPTNSASTTGTTARTTAATRTSTSPRFVRSEVVQNTPADAGPPSDGELPICESNAQDNCINAWEAGKRGPGVNRPLEYWPGRPASEIDESLPATRSSDDNN
ncbi:hypothetical protein [Erythrobacter sp. SD-21]|uniref:hypothetical protein n=1 Tax=Erythrobacter sp. SD-21 TaxID=161528 RepID=UPI000153F452|nr:hypothetical protein [Erythrobacter sp. SD-21]EDL50178.1 hypothetical protein ED21_26943 [Erythrobacter sp. SD-21]